MQLLKRKRGGQPGNKNGVGNQNAVKHGRYTAAAKAAKAARLAEWRAEWTARELASLAWTAEVEKRCRLQHARILEEIRRERAERELIEPGLWPPI